MPLLRINAADHGLCLHRSAQPLGPTLARMAQGAGPTIVMVHGYRFAPGAGADCPHRHILSTDDQPPHWKALSWPRALGLGTQNQPGLAIAFGWQALGSLWQAHARATQAGLALADLIQALHRLAPDRPIHAIGHSMGARVILSALPHVPPGSLHRLLLLAPAEYRSTATAALNTPAGRQTETFTITSRENDLYDFALERLIAPPQPKDRIMGSAPPDAPNLLTLHLDNPHLLDALKTRGLPIAPPQRRICHWSAYLRPGVFDLYRALLLQPQRHPFRALQAALPDQPPPRWSRLFAPPRPTVSLPLLRKAPS